MTSSGWSIARAAACGLALALAPCADAADVNQRTDADAAPDAPARPRIGLVLSGGGARGLAHIGVLQGLRELRVPVDRVVGTSMGAVVGGAYAAGQPIETIERFALRDDWDRLFDGRGARRDLDYRRKRDDDRLLTAPAFSIGRDGLTLPRGAYDSHGMEAALRRLAAPARDIADLDRLPIPFRSVAADLESGALVRMRHVPLATAMHASIAVPGAFAPLAVEGRLLVDGGIVRNLPIDVAREMLGNDGGAHVLIAVNVGTPPVERSELASALAISVQMLALLIEQNVSESLARLRPGDVLIAPALRDIGASEFERARELIELGRQATLAERDRMLALALPPDEYAAWEAARVRVPAATRVQLGAIRLRGMAAPEETRAMLRRLPLAAGDTVDEARIETALTRLYGTGRFERIDYRLQPTDDPPGAQELVITAVERAGGPGALRFGWSLESDFRETNRFNVAAGYTHAPLNRFGTEWRSYVQVGAQRVFETELLQPLGAGSEWFVAPVLSYTAFEFDTFGPEGTRIRRNAVESSQVTASIGRQFGSIGEARVGYGRSRTTLEPLISETVRTGGVSYQTVYVARGVIDTWDSVSFPREGILLGYEYQRVARRTEGAAGTSVYGLGTLAPLIWGHNTILFGAALQRARGEAAVSLGGFLNLSGTPVDQMTGQRSLLLRSIYFRRIADLPRGLGVGVYAGGSLEIGAAVPESSNFTYGAMKRAGALIIGFDSAIGPVYFAVGQTHQGGSAVYLFVGRL